MKITKEELNKIIKEAVQKKLKEASLDYTDLLPGVDGGLQEYVEEVEVFLLETANRAEELYRKADEMMRADILNHPKIGEKNRVLLSHAGVLRTLHGNITTIFRFLRQQG